MDELEGVVRFLVGGCKFNNFCFLECVASYPAKPEDYNLRTILADHEFTTDRVLGISDHTMSGVVSLVSVGLGATIFEKHFKAFEVPGICTPDFPVSVGPTELAKYVRHIHEGFAALGDGVKRTRGCEKDMTLRHRRRLKVIEPIKAGEELRYGVNFGIYRSITEDPTAGPPEMYLAFHGGIAKVDLSPGDPVWTSNVSIPEPPEECHS